MHFYLVPRSLQRTFEQFSILFTLKDIGLKRMSQKILIKYKKTATAET